MTENNLGPLSKLIGTPWHQQQPSRRGGGTQAPAPDFSISDSITVKSRFSANPGVLVSGRRPEKPGKQ